MLKRLAILSVAEHVHTVISSSAQTLYALGVLRAHGMDDVPLQTIYRSVAIAKLTYASSALVLPIFSDLKPSSAEVTVVVLF